nr:MAG TPA: hypothetical protein [Caudoviricetes sp.]
MVINSITFSLQPSIKSSFLFYSSVVRFFSVRSLFGYT